MVATRSQEHVTPGYNLHILSENGTPTTEPGKRKRKTDPPSTASPQPRAKQQKIIDQPMEPSPSAIVTAVLIPPPTSWLYDGQNENRDSCGDFSSRNAQTQAEDSASASPFGTRELPNEKTIEESYTSKAKASTSDHKRDAEKDIEIGGSQTSMVEKPAGTAKIPFLTTAAPPSKKKKKKPSKPNARTEPTSPTNPLASKPPPKPKTHKRFHSEEPPPSLSNPEPAHPPLNPETADVDEDEEDDDNAAPETIAHPSSRAHPSLALAAAAAAKAQKEAAKQRRRARDSLLKSQKQQKQERKQKRKQEEHAFPAPPSAAAAALDKEGEDRSRSSRGDLTIPDLLPLEILAEEPAPRAPTPPLLDERPTQQVSTKAPKRKLLDRDPRPRKDIKVGNYKVRVLEGLMPQTGLPPKASKNSKAIRERWLVGREGAKGKMSVERRGWSVGGGGGRVGFWRR
ncbi:MAG: hypothetical protein LQ342_004170 [Letrouitia transgressa]|nr:MAG: hypothetical protein LQ342_004170 [Letrouitia transgressa]